MKAGLKNISFRPVWFDSLGAKSSCTLVKTPDAAILIDPGVAVMQPSFPASQAQKLSWFNQGKKAIKEASREAGIIIITHYHYDHFTDFDKTLLENKLVLVKDPNQFINDSQRRRAENFYTHLCNAFANTELNNMLDNAKRREYAVPIENLPLATSRDFGDYTRRRRELLEKGEKWFYRRVKNWNTYMTIPELRFDKVTVKIADGRRFKIGETVIRFTKPLFHGIEYSRVGWVIATVIEHGEEKLIYSSDINGPIIEDYAQWIINENPDVLILDGPMTYMLGYLLNNINLNRAVENACRLVEETATGLIIYDHHLPREPNFKERTELFWRLAREKGKQAATAAELLGKRPVVLNKS